MPLQNRVLPDQSIVAIPARGLLTGNRGILHDETRSLRRRWTSRAWICCALQWKAIRRTPMTGRSWTELFFLDEPVALAAGHRPCATCRRAAYTAFRSAWDRAHLPGARAPEIDAHLHAARLDHGQQRRHQAQAETLPDGAFILTVRPHLILGPHALPFTPDGYLPPIPRPAGEVTVLTPAALVAVLHHGFRPILHPTAHAPIAP